MARGMGETIELKMDNLVRIEKIAGNAERGRFLTISKSYCALNKIFPFI